MKSPLLLPLLLLSACTIHIGPTHHEVPDDARIQQLIDNIPDHGIENASRDEFEPEYYDLLYHAWAIPEDAVGELGSNEWLYYFVTGNDDMPKETVLGEVSESNDTVVANFNIVFDTGGEVKDSMFHYLTLTHNGEKWVISDFDDTKYQLQKYIREQRLHFKSQEWQDYLSYLLREYPDCSDEVDAKKHEIDQYFRQYPE